MSSCTKYSVYLTLLFACLIPGIILVMVTNQPLDYQILFIIIPIVIFDCVIVYDYVKLMKEVSMVTTKVRQQLLLAFFCGVGVMVISQVFLFVICLNHSEYKSSQKIVDVNNQESVANICSCDYSSVLDVLDTVNCYYKEDLEVSDTSDMYLSSESFDLKPTQCETRPLIEQELIRIINTQNNGCLFKIPYEGYSNPTLYYGAEYEVSTIQILFLFIVVLIQCFCSFVSFILLHVLKTIPYQDTNLLTTDFLEMNDGINADLENENEPVLESNEFGGVVDAVTDLSEVEEPEDDDEIEGEDSITMEIFHEGTNNNVTELITRNDKEENDQSLT